jgi:hypothetical protein
MSIVCSRCNVLHDSPNRCPRCGAVASLATVDAQRARWTQTPWGRIGIGVVVAQGVFYGLFQLLVGGMMAVYGMTSEEVRHGVHGVLLVQLAQAIALVASGVLTGGGQRHGLVLGGVVGVWSGVLSALLQQNPTPNISLLALYGQPLISGAIGAFAGWAGSLIWKPIPPVHTPGLPLTPRMNRRMVQPLFAGKVAWIRVILGALLAVAGSRSAGIIFNKIIDIGAGQLDTPEELYDIIITWEIRVLAMLIGGALAGAWTTNGFKQGVLVGFFALFLFLSQETRLLRYYPRELQAVLLGTSVILATLGGWLGGQIFPPITNFKPARGTLGSVAGP